MQEQGEELCFYKSNRNEPVPPDPAIISAVKKSHVVPPPKNAIPPNMHPGKVTTIHKPSMNWFEKPRKIGGIPPPAHTKIAEVLASKSTSSQSNNVENGVVKTENSNCLKTSNSEKCVSENKALDTSVSTNKFEGGYPAVRPLRRSQNQQESDDNEVAKDGKSSVTNEAKVKVPEIFLKANDRPTEVRVVKQFSKQEFVVSCHIFYCLLNTAANS